MENPDITDILRGARGSDLGVATLWDPQTRCWHWALGPGPGCLGGAPYRLLEALSLKEGPGSWRLLRERILVTRRPRFSERLLIRLGAKRMGLLDEALGKDEQPSGPAIEHRLDDSEVMGLIRSQAEWQGLQELLGTRWDFTASGAMGRQALLAVLQRRIEGLPGRRVGAALLDAGGEVRAVSVNLPGLVPIWHAELLAFKDFFDRVVGSDFDGTSFDWTSFELLTTLKPCRFCAALCVEMLWNEKVVPAKPLIHYGQRDEGAFAQRTLLDRDSPDQRAFGGTVLGLQLEQQVF